MARAGDRPMRRSRESGLPTYEATLADGTRLTAEQVVQQFGKPFSGATKQPMTADQWVELVNSRGQ